LPTSPRPLRPFGEKVPGTELVTFGVMTGREEQVLPVQADRKATRSKSDCFETVRTEKNINATYATGRMNPILEPLPRAPGLLGQVSMHASATSLNSSPNLRASLRPLNPRKQPVIQGTHAAPQRPLLPPLEHALNPGNKATTVRGPLPDKIDQELWSRRKIQFWEMGVIGPKPLGEGNRLASLDWRTAREYG